MRGIRGRRGDVLGDYPVFLDAHAAFMRAFLRYPLAVAMVDANSLQNQVPIREEPHCLKRERGAR